MLVQMSCLFSRDTLHIDPMIESRITHTVTVYSCTFEEWFSKNYIVRDVISQSSPCRKIGQRRLSRVRHARSKCVIIYVY